MYHARQTPRFDTPAAWSDILGHVDQSAPLSKNMTADVVVVGGGFAGLSAARRLTQIDEGLRIVVLDALRIAEGSAGRNSGFMIDLPHDLASDHYAGAGDDRALIDLNRAAIAFARDAVAQYGIPCAFADPVGKVNGAATSRCDANNRQYAAHLNSLGEESQMLDAQQMHELTGSRYYRSGLFTPGTLMLQPAGYIKQLAHGLRAAGVEIFENSAVTGFARAGSDWQVRTAKAQVTAPRVILATNGHLESFGIAKGQLMQVFLYASMTPELSDEQVRALGGAPRWGITPSDPMGTTMRRIDTAQGGNRIITRTCATLRPAMVARRADVQRAARVHQSKFDRRFSTLAGMRMQYAWAGHLCLTRNGVSVTRMIEEGLFAACVQNGLGTARGTLTGIAAAEMALGQSSPVTRFFSAERPPKAMPPDPFGTWGANAYLRWKEWRARAE